MKKWKIELIVVLVLAISGLIVWNHINTKPDREAESQRTLLVKFAEKQALEIRIIEQASKLTQYKQQMETAKLKAEKAPKVVADPNK